VSPAEDAALVLPALPMKWQLTADELAQFVPRSSPRFAAHLEASADVRGFSAPPLAMLKTMFLRNRPTFEGAKRLVARRDTDVVLFYTSLVDAVEHKFWRYYEPGLFDATPPEDLADFADTIPRAYEYVDRQLQALIDAAPADATFLVISDHGHHAAPDHPYFSGHHEDGPPGIIICAGPGIRPGGEVTGATLYDIEPTVLALVDLPVPQDVSGRVIDDLFVAPRTVQHVATYRDLATQAPAEPKADHVDPALGERLRALGYTE
jgi:hypothetical protein